MSSPPAIPLPGGSGFSKGLIAAAYQYDSVGLQGRGPNCSCHVETSGCGQEAAKRDEIDKDMPLAWMSSPTPFGPSSGRRSSQVGHSPGNHPAQDHVSPNREHTQLPKEFSVSAKHGS